MKTVLAGLGGGEERGGETALEAVMGEVWTLLLSPLLLLGLGSGTFSTPPPADLCEARLCEARPDFLLDADGDADADLPAVEELRFAWFRMALLLRTCSALLRRSFWDFQ
jgi:hypothetical protein